MMTTSRICWVRFIANASWHSFHREKMARLTSLSKMIVKVNPTHRLIYVLSPSQKPHFCHGEVASAKKR